MPSPATKAITPVAASTAKVGWKPAAASRNPHSVVPTIWPKLVTAFRRPSCTPRAPGSSLAIAQVAGQNAARASTSTSWPTSSIQKPWANINHRPAAMVATARAEQDAAPADAVGIGAAHQVEGRLREHRDGEQDADLGVGQALG